jgi:hypothetical protein
MSAALEFLVGYGLADQDGTSYFITKAGRRALQAKGGE